MEAALAMIDWLTGHLAKFDPDAGQAPTERPFTMGPLIELLMAGRALRHCPELPVAGRAAVDAWCAFAGEVLRRPGSQARILDQPAYLPFFCVAAVMAGEPEAIELTSRLSTSGVGEHELSSRHPNGRLEAAWARSLASTEHAGALDEPELLHGTTLEALPALAYLTENDAYAFTHAIFYLTDFGALPWQDSARAAALTVQTRHLLAWVLLRRQADLVAELLICLRYLGAPVSPIEALSRQRLLAGRVGPAVAGPFFRSEVAAGMPDPERAGIYLFRTSFHTTLVSAIALSRPMPAAELPAEPPAELRTVREILQAGKAELPLGRMPAGLEEHEWLTRSVQAARVLHEARSRFRPHGLPQKDATRAPAHPQNRPCPGAAVR